MSVPDLDKIVSKLERDGEEEVRRKLLLDAYAQNKIPIVEDWLRRQEMKKTQEETTEPTRVDRFLASAKNHRILSVVIIAFVVITGVAAFTDAVKSLWDLIPSRNGYGSLADIEGDTGWIFAGYFDIDREVFIEGPYVGVNATARRGRRRYVEVGDTVRLNVSRKVYVIDYSISGSQNRLKSPIEKGILDENDETGVTLAPDTEYVARDVSEGHWPGNPNAALWLRVIDLPQ